MLTPHKDYLFENSDNEDDLGVGMNIQAIDEQFEMELSSTKKKERPDLNRHVVQEFQTVTGESITSKGQIEPLRYEAQKKKKIKIVKK